MSFRRPESLERAGVMRRAEHGLVQNHELLFEHTPLRPCVASPARFASVALVTPPGSNGIAPDALFEPPCIKRQVQSLAVGGSLVAPPEQRAIMVSPQTPSSWSIPTARATRLQALTRGLAFGVASRRIHPAGSLFWEGVTCTPRWRAQVQTGRQSCSPTVLLWQHIKKCSLEQHPQPGRLAGNSSPASTQPACHKVH